MSFAPTPVHTSGFDDRVADASGFALKLPPVVDVGAGAVARLPQHAQRLGIRRPLIVTDAWLCEHGPVGAAAEALEGAGLPTAVHSDVHTDPTVDDVAAGLATLRRHEADGVIAIGGGSPIDAAKAIAVMAPRPDAVISDFAGYDRIGGAALPLIAVPTTAGSGSEQTRATVIADPAAETKLAIYDDALLPATAIVDFELSITQPRALTTHVGLDALVHAIEAYVSRLATPVSDMLALEAARLVWPNLRAAVEQPENRAARAAMMLGSSLAGAAFSNSSVCLVHGMSRPLGAQFHVEHGLSNALLLDVVTRFSVPGAPDRYAQFARALGIAPAEADDAAANDVLLATLRELVEALEVPALSALGVTRAALEAVVDAMAAAALASGSPGFNPRQPDHAEIVALYREVYR